MLQPLTVRNLTLGSGMPKIVVPIVERTERAILQRAESLKPYPADMAEWRADFFEGALDLANIRRTLAALRGALGDMPLLFTFRTAREGGEAPIEPAYYAALNAAAAQSGCADLIDVEVFGNDALARESIQNIHAAGRYAVGSSHDFSRTPPRGELVRRLRAMQDMGADVLKIAVMPERGEDVLTLLAAASEMRELYANRPIAAISMGPLGLISRLAGEAFGSALTFASVNQASAPGQIPARELKGILETLHRSL